jgi:hypothetical protein
MPGMDTSGNYIARGLVLYIASHLTMSDYPPRPARRNLTMSDYSPHPVGRNLTMSDYSPRPAGRNLTMSDAFSRSVFGLQCTKPCRAQYSMRDVGRYNRSQQRTKQSRRPSREIASFRYIMQDAGLFRMHLHLFRANQFLTRIFFVCGIPFM